MKLQLYILLILLLSLGANAQTMRGIVVDAETNKALSAATVHNIATGATAITDDQGNFALEANTGQLLTISFYGYTTLQRLANPARFAKIELQRIAVKLPEYTVTELTKFQKDSIEMTELYSKELNKRGVKPGFSSANGGGFTGLIGGPVQRMSRSYKQNKRFQQTFKHDMEQKYVATTYTPALVSSLTGYKGDTLANFMNTYEMEHSFARQASDLEMKMWIRDNFKEYNKQLLSKH